MSIVYYGWSFPFDVSLKTEEMTIYGIRSATNEIKLNRNAL